MNDESTKVGVRDTEPVVSGAAHDIESSDGEARPATQALRVVSLGDPDAHDASVVGNKAAGLARLGAWGFDVPPAMVLPVGIASLADSRDLDDLLHDTLPELLHRVGQPVAVRASATWEDSAISAHAGATVTELDVRGVDQVSASVRRCLAGTLHAQKDRRASGDVAVIIQKLVPADQAGVAFTADPLTGERDVVRIAATDGLGEALVQGEVTGTDITVRTNHPLTGDSIRGDIGSLRTDQVLELARVARRIEEKAGRPQDIEWAIEGDRLQILQSRDITVLPVEPALPEGNNWRKDLAHYPEPLTPFGWSVIHLPADDVHAVFDEMGLLIRGLEEVCVGGEVYGRALPAFGDANGAGNPPPAFVLGLAARVVPTLRKRTAVARRALAADLPQRWLDDWHSEVRDRMIALDKELRTVTLGSLSDEGLATHGRRCATMLRDGTAMHFRLIMPYARALYDLHRIVTETLGWDDDRTVRMLAGYSPATRAAHGALASIRARIERTDGAFSALEDNPRDPVAALADVDPELADHLAGWMDQHGWAIVNYDAGVPVLAERPGTVTRLLCNTPTDVGYSDADEIANEARTAIAPERCEEFDEILAKALEVYPVREDNTIILGDRPMGLLRRWMLEVGARLAARDELASPADAAYLSYQELVAALSGNDTGDLVASVLRRRGEEAWTRAHPGPTHIGAQSAPPNISRLPEPLRVVNEPVLWVVGHEYPEAAAESEDPNALLTGVPASAGVAQGTVRVIRSHSEIDRLGEGDVLVCPVTSPAWSPVFPLASAIVADGGGAFSHAAIAARENGLPAVLGTGVATSTLTDGQLVRVDGTRGVVSSVDQ
ncbi:MAG: PEP/pyruvate-binding domain-containing protein [Microthrixaceae bacterium]